MHPKKSEVRCRTAETNGKDGRPNGFLNFVDFVTSDAELVDLVDGENITHMLRDVWIEIIEKHHLCCCFPEKKPRDSVVQTEIFRQDLLLLFEK